MIRTVILAVSALGSAVAFGRKYVDKSIEKKLGEEIEAAKLLAVEQLDREIDDVVRHRLGNMALSLLTKAGLVAAAYLIFSAGLIADNVFRGAVVALIIAFMAYDWWRVGPHVPTILKLCRGYQFNGKRALKEYVATVTFDRAYEQTMERLETGKTRQLVAISNYSAGDLSEKVALAVSQVAAEVSFDRVKPRVIVGALRAGLLLVSYAAFFALVVWA